MFRLLFALMACSVLSSCLTTKDQYVYFDKPIKGEKVIAIVGTRWPWVSEIESRLRQKGFTIKRYASLVEATDTISKTRKETYNVATARVVLKLDGYAPNTFMERCIAGGFRFEFINAEIIDLRKNETMAVYSNSGYSENCTPLSGTIFGDIVALVDSAFEQKK